MANPSNVSPPTGKPRKLSRELCEMLLEPIGGPGLIDQQ